MSNTVLCLTWRIIKIFNELSQNRQLPVSGYLSSQERQEGDRIPEQKFKFVLRNSTASNDPKQVSSLVVLPLVVLVLTAGKSILASFSVLACLFCNWSLITFELTLHKSCQIYKNRLCFFYVMQINQWNSKAKIFQTVLFFFIHYETDLFWYDNVAEHCWSTVCYRSVGCKSDSFFTLCVGVHFLS